MRAIQTSDIAVELPEQSTRPGETNGQTSFLQLAALWVLASLADAQAIEHFAKSGPTPIQSPRPLADASVLLQHLYGRAVTYEEPVLTWNGELQPLNHRDPTQKWAVMSMPRTFTMPTETGVEPDLSLILNRTLQAYHQQTTGTRFRVLTSALGYHIVPAQVHDATGQMAEAASALEALVMVPAEERTPYGHLAALVAAVANAAGTRVVVGVNDPHGFERVYRSRPERFQWGAATGTVARDALVDLLQRSSTSMLWQLWCQPSAKAEDRFCALNISMLEVTVTDPQGRPANRVLKFDRCGDCPSAQPSVPALPQPLQIPGRSGGPVTR